MFYANGSLLFSQSGIEPSKLKQFNITINFDDYTVKTQMLSQNKNICVNNDRTYMWYCSQKLIETKGGYDGKLIHGTYRAFYLNNQLKEQGQIRYGLRHREWKYWYPDGKLREVITWRKGEKRGPYLLYNDYGQLMAKGSFRNDKLHGSFYTYGPNGKVTDKKRYKEGEEIMTKKPVPKTKKELRKKNSKDPSPGKKSGPGQNEKKEEKSGDKKTPFFDRLFKKKSATAQPKPGRKNEKKVITS